MLTTSATPRPCPVVAVVAGGPRRLMAAPPPAAGTLALAWLGQAGFLVRTARHTILIDPYLSDCLADKYRGQEFPHERMMPPPLDVADVDRLDLVLCTHRHSDHMDPDTLREIAGRRPGCRFLVPAADATHAAGLGLPADRLLPIDAGETVTPHEGLAITALPAAHEALDRDESGRCRYLGYALHTAGLTIYHSGDTVAFLDLPRMLDRLAVAAAILPANGRDAFRAARGVPGNMAAAEAIALCRAAGIPLLVPCHFGMFAFNSATTADLDLLHACRSPRTLVPDVDHHLLISPRTESPS